MIFLQILLIFIVTNATEEKDQITYDADEIVKLPLFIQEISNPSLFWRASNPETKQILFILGTHHETPLEVANHYALQLVPYVQNCESFYVEHLTNQNGLFEKDLMSHFTSNDLNFLETREEFIESHNKLAQSFGVSAVQLFDYMMNVPTEDVRSQNTHPLFKSLVDAMASTNLNELMYVLSSSESKKVLLHAVEMDLLYSRTDLWMQKILHLNNSFIAVGSAHVYLKNGVLDLLHKNNWILESIEIEPMVKLL